MKNARTLVLLLVVVSLVTALSLPGLAADTIRIGTNYEMTGAVATFGTNCTNSARLAIEEANAKGGALGRKFELITFDNKSDAAEASTGAAKLIDQDKVVAILGSMTSTCCLSAGPVAQDKKIPMITPTGTNPRVTQVGDYIFRACFLDDFQGEVMAVFAYKNLKKKTAAILVDNASDYSKGLAKFFKQKFTSLGGKVLLEEGFMPEDKEFTAQLLKVKSSKAEVLFVPCYYQPAGLISKQAREMKINIPILGGDGWDSTELVKTAGPKPLNNIFFSNHYSPDSTSKLNKDFVKTYTAKFGQPPDAFAALGYDAAWLIIDAIKRANSADPKLIRDALAKTTDFVGVAGPIRFDANRNPIKSAVIIELKNGVQRFKAEVQP